MGGVSLSYSATLGGQRSKLPRAMNIARLVPTPFAIRFAYRTHLPDFPDCRLPNFNTVGIPVVKVLEDGVERKDHVLTLTDHVLLPPANDDEVVGEFVVVKYEPNCKFYVGTLEVLVLSCDDGCKRSERGWGC